MGRRHPPRGRRFYRPPASIQGLPRTTCHALDLLDDPGPCAAEVGWALRFWDHYTRIPPEQHRGARDPFEEDGAERAWDVLESAVAALDERSAAPLRRRVRTMNERLLTGSVPLPAAPPGRPWWQRRDWS
ncbi:hypothetical protein [Pseudonocardia sp. HH130630-07]|uniref:hypothetical protein n=1 Tax=Pseudonocardia sp. HH130630-07 TaxID=1690815 RepID=UPI000815396F|nr:hypothetical protein [Pseudonocardia sp. HH130630-07]ANY07341.1 hypothetical protein AFB00_14775 [Pseudonocardia sp. HH130630-07]